MFNIQTKPLPDKFFSLLVSGSVKVNMEEIIKLFKEGNSYKEIAKITKGDAGNIAKKLKSLGYISEGARKAKEIKDLAEQGLRKCFKCLTVYPNNPSLFVSGKKPAACCLSCKTKLNKKKYQNERQNMSLETYLHNKLINVKSRCKLKKENYNLDLKYVLDLYQEQKAQCYYSGIDMKLYGTQEEKLYSLSIDRIDNNRGYEKGNIVLCCNIVNTMKNSVPVHVFIDICKRIASKN
jgi:hypothetical protein